MELKVSYQLLKLVFLELFLNKFTFNKIIQFFQYSGKFYFKERSLIGKQRKSIKEKEICNDGKR